jgi:hypothetical protein
MRVLVMLMSRPVSSHQPHVLATFGASTVPKGARHMASEFHLVCSLWHNPLRSIVPWSATPLHGGLRCRQFDHVSW